MQDGIEIEVHDLGAKIKVVGVGGGGGNGLNTMIEAGLAGVDFIAVGALTHSAPVLDIGADLRDL